MFCAQKQVWISWCKVLDVSFLSCFLVATIQAADLKNYFTWNQLRMPGGFFKKPPAIRNEDIEPISDTMPPPTAPATTTSAATSGTSSEHLLAPTTSWLKAISARRGSNMFEGGMSPMDGDNSNDAAYHHGSGGGHSGSGGHSEASFRSNTLAIPKSVFSAFNDDSTGGENLPISQKTWRKLTQLFNSN